MDCEDDLRKTMTQIDLDPKVLIQKSVMQAIKDGRKKQNMDAA